MGGIQHTIVGLIRAHPLQGISDHCRVNQSIGNGLIIGGLIVNMRQIDKIIVGVVTIIDRATVASAKIINRVISGTCGELIVPAAADHQVIAGPTKQRIIAVAPGEGVIAIPTKERIVIVSSLNTVIAFACQNRVVAITGNDRIVVVPGGVIIVIDHVAFGIACIGCVDPVIATGALNNVIGKHILDFGKIDADPFTRIVGVDGPTAF
ncbi:hypothetical protein SCH4B_3063 [Ruegeria sp. TrichCH4B]|nr:hypothetical protein SCH4B_3063 [Ruegeria sp. TrichCH4B]